MTKEDTMPQGNNGPRNNDQRKRTFRPDRAPPRQNRAGSNGAGNPKKTYERYVSLAQAAAAAGDTIATENYYQHAEHYFRLMRERVA
jgi:hypothetical protein